MLTLHKRQRSPKRIGPYTRLSKLWTILVLSLPLDALWAFIPHPRIPEESAQATAISCAVVALLFLNQTNVAKALSNLRSFGKTPSTHRTRGLQFALLIPFVAILAVKLTLVPNIVSALGGLCALIILVGVLRAAQKASKEQQRHIEQLNANPMMQVTIWESQLVIFVGIPMLAARMISLIGALANGSRDVTLLSITCFACSLLILLSLKPHRDTFVGLCKRCKAPIPIAFVDYGSCPLCDQELAQKLTGTK